MKNLGEGLGQQTLHARLIDVARFGRLTRPPMPPAPTLTNRFCRNTRVHKNTIEILIGRWEGRQTFASLLLSCKPAHRKTYTQTYVYVFMSCLLGIETFWMNSFCTVRVCFLSIMPVRLARTGKAPWSRCRQRTGGTRSSHVKPIRSCSRITCLAPFPL